MAKMNWGGANYLAKIERNGSLYKLDDPSYRRLAKRADAILEKAETRKVTRKEVYSKRTKAGGWTRSQLAQWGVPWPPTKGWIERLTGEAPKTPMPEIRPKRVIWGDRWDDVFEPANKFRGI